MALKVINVAPGSDEIYTGEWLEANGTGGYSSSSISGSNTRRYHGAFVKPIGAGFERSVLLSKLDETLITNDVRYALQSNLFGESHLEAGDCLERFEKDLFPEWYYSCGDIKLKKTVCAVHRRHLILIRYEVLTARQPFSMDLLPLVAARGYHSLVHKNQSLNEAAQFDSSLYIQPYGEDTGFYISGNGLSYESRPLWYYNFFYPREQDRGQDYTEDLFSPGLLKMNLKAGEIGWIVIHAEPTGTAPSDPSLLFYTEQQRRLKLLKDHAVDRFSSYLLLAADQFLIEKNPKDYSVIAGYHWFTDWGRDTMISLPGLCLFNNRKSEAKAILRHFASHTFQGLIPNRFADGQVQPVYNTADASLWFFVAAYQYWKAGGELAFIIGELLPILNSVIEWHLKGTLFGIHADTDGLIWAGEHGAQLSWMDAKVGDWVVTPRTGKAIEINALWFNALNIFSQFLTLNKESDKATAYQVKATQVKTEFNRQFWCQELGYLYDVIDTDSKDRSFRPNQLFAISLPFSLLEQSKAEQVLALIEQRLYTRVGLRSLAPGDSKFRPRYEGNGIARDGSYHQGTVWSWLLGPYIDALVKFRKELGRVQAKQVIERFAPHLSEAGIGTVSEIFDATEPLLPKGCIAQAWGVAELLRVYYQYSLYR